MSANTDRLDSFLERFLVFVNIVVNTLFGSVQMTTMVIAVTSEDKGTSLPKILPG